MKESPSLKRKKANRSAQSYYEKREKRDPVNECDRDGKRQKTFDKSSSTKPSRAFSSNFDRILCESCTMDSKGYIVHSHNFPKRIKHSFYKQRKRPPPAFKIIENMEDVFCSILRYFIADSGLIDGQSIRSVMLVSKSWNVIASSKLFWTPHCTNSCGSDSMRNSGCPRRKGANGYVIGLTWQSAKNNLSQSTSNIVQTIVTPQIEDNLMAFAKLGIHCIGSENTCFKVRERSTGKLYTLKAPKYTNFNVKQETSPSTSTLREIAALQRLNSFTNPKKRSININMPQGITLINGNLFRWYDFIQYTLEDVLQCGSFISIRDKSVLSADIIKIWTSQMMNGIEFIHRRGIIHRNLKPKHILLRNLTSLSQENFIQDLSKVSIEISDFTEVRENSFLDRPLSPKATSLRYRPPEMLLGTNKYSFSVDIWSIGCIFAEILTGNPLFTGSTEMDQMLRILESVNTPSTCYSNKKYDSSESNKIWLEGKVPTACNLGIDLLSKLLHLDPSKRISAAKALLHPYLNENMDLNGDDKPIEKSQKEPSSYIISKELRCLEVTTNICEVRGQSKTPMRIGHWAKLVDWMVEIVDVFEKHPRTVFLAMDFFLQFISNVMVSKTRHYQLLAASCLRIASKCEDVDCINLTDLAFSADNAFTGDDILFVEKKILEKMKWRLSNPLIYDFVNLYLDHLEKTFVSVNISVTRIHWMALYISELALQSITLLRTFEPSLIAACIISLSMECLWNHFPLPSSSSSSRSNHQEILYNIWPKELSIVSGYELNSSHSKNIQDCRNALFSNLHHVRISFPELNIISKRYRTKERGRVSDVRFPSLLRFVELS